MVSTPQKIALGKNSLIREMIKDKREYNSSAEHLDKTLQEKSIFTTHRFAQEYIFPENRTHAEFEKYLYENYELYIRCKNGLPDRLREAQKGSYWADVRADILKELPLKKEQMKKDYNQLRNLNPCLENIQADSIYKIYDVLRGATYKFGANEIEFFINSRKPEDKEAANNFSIKMWKDNKIQIGYMLAPQSREKLSTIIENNNKNKSAQRFMDYREEMGYYND